MRSRRSWISLFILIGLFAALVFFLDLRKIAQAILSISPIVVVLTFIIATLDRFMMGYKWRQMIVAVGESLSISGAVSAYYQSALSSRILPVPMASDLLRGHLIARLGVPKEVVWGSMALEKLVAWIACTLLALASLFYLIFGLNQESGAPLLLGLLAAFGAGAALLFLILYKPLHDCGSSLIQKYLPVKLQRLLDKLSHALLAYREQPAAIAVNLLLALGEQLLQVAKFYVLGRALGINLPLLPFLAIMMLMIAARRVLAYFESWGVAEVGTIVVLTGLGIDQNTAVALIFLNFAITTIASLPGAYLMYQNGLGFGHYLDQPSTLPHTNK